MQNLKGIGAYGTVGLDFAVAVAIGTYGGWWLDQKLGWTPGLTIAGLLFGVAAGFNVLFKVSKRLREETEREDRRQRESERNKSSNDGNDDPNRR